MRIIILAQEEPIYFGPFFRKLLATIHSETVLLVIAGTRGAGSHPKTFKEKVVDIYNKWLMFEPAGFMHHLSTSLWQKTILSLGMLGGPWDKRSLRGAAHRAVTCQPPL